MTRRTLYRGAALADGTSPELVHDVSVLVEDGVLLGLWTDGAAPDERGDVEEDASGATLVPGLVDSHNHVTMPGGADWIARGLAERDELLRVAEESGDLLRRSGVGWIRDVGSPRREGRAVALEVRDAWRGRTDRPVLHAAGTWLGRPGKLPDRLGLGVPDHDALVAAAAEQLDQGADLVKLYLDGPDSSSAAFDAAAVSAVSALCHARGARVAAHATTATAARTAAQGGVDSIEHGTYLDDDTVHLMAAQGISLVSTLVVWHSILGFATTTSAPRWREGEPQARELLEQAESSTRRAHTAGVPLAAGSDAGGGSCRHGTSVAWEVVALVHAGVPGWQAVAAATWRGGELLGDPHAGRLVVEQPARALLVHGDPYLDPTALWRVWRVL